jgi:hypothetical protein
MSGRALEPRRDKGSQDRQRQHPITPPHRLIKERRYVRMPRQRAMPFTILASKTADALSRQLDIDQRDSRVSPRSRFNQAIDLGRPFRLPQRVLGYLIE